MADHADNANTPIPSELVRENPEFADLVEEFLGGMPKAISHLESTLAEADFEALRRAAHQLKGSGGGYGYPAVSEFAARLERQAVAARLEACRRDFEELKKLVSRLVVSTG